MSCKRDIGFGVVGGGYMGKAHAIALRAAPAVFDTALVPRLVSIAATTLQNAQTYRDAYGFERAAPDWRALVEDPDVEAVVIATYQDSHRDIAEAALRLGKPVLCQKPLSLSSEDSAALVAAADRSGAANMVGFNYTRPPVFQHARDLITSGALGRITYLRAEHVEDYYADPARPAGLKTRTAGFGALADIGSHVINMCHALVGPIDRLCADLETVHATRDGPDGDEAVITDDQGQFLCRFASGPSGHVLWSRVQTGRKMGYAVEVFGERGALRFDNEDQNALWFYQVDDDAPNAGFRKIIAGPMHPDYRAFNLGPGHGTGFIDTVIIEARDFLQSIETGEPVRPTFRDGHAVNLVMEAVRASSDAGSWVDVASK